MSMGNYSRGIAILNVFRSLTNSLQRCDSGIIPLFRNVFVVKSCVYLLIEHPVSGGHVHSLVSGWYMALMVILVSTAVGVWVNGWSRLALLIVLMAQVAKLIELYPLGINHHHLEALITCVLLVFDEDRIEEDRIEEKASRRCGVTRSGVLLRLSLVSVWVYAGVQKIAHGRFINGEVMGLYGLFESNKYAWIGSGLSQLGWMPAGSLLQWPETLLTQPLPGVDGLGSVMRIVSWAVVITEVGVPLLVFHPRWRGLGVVGLLVLQLFIGVGASEVSFMFTGLGALSLFCPQRWARRLLWLVLSGVLMEAMYAGF
jgi:hypothetical protein